MMTYGGVTHLMHSTEKNKIALAHAGSRAEIAILENEELHSLLFTNVVWTKEEEHLKKEGLFVKTLELAPPQEFVFGLCRKWSFMQHLNKFGFPKFIAYDDAKKYATGGAYISLIADSASRENFVNAGRLMERIWLIANLHDYAVHPITATLFFGLKIRAEKVSGLTSESWELMRSAYALIRKTLELPENKEVLFMFRIGEAPRVRFRSSKKAPVVYVD